MNIAQLHVYELVEIWREQLINVIMTFNNESPLKMIKTKTKSNLQHNATKRHPDKKIN